MSMENEAIKTILARRSVRRYENKPVDREKIDKILECASAAPSANNFRPWHFVEVTKREALDVLADIHPYGKMLAQAPLAIIVCAEKERQGSPDVWWEQDCSAAMENILVSATALGLGSVWLGVYHHEASGFPNKIRGLLGIPSHIQVMGIAAIGYGAEEKPSHQGIDPARVHQERW
ncbi:MAG: nitroreductase family protein [Synergistaceae bacterium]|nr:nitroreductase family protein [Synergistaceae bacterium]